MVRRSFSFGKPRSVGVTSGSAVGLAEEGLERGWTRKGLERVALCFMETKMGTNTTKVNKIERRKLRKLDGKGGDGGKVKIVDKWRRDSAVSVGWRGVCRPNRGITNFRLEISNE